MGDDLRGEDGAEPPDLGQGVARRAASIDGWNDRFQPFAWTEPSDELSLAIEDLVMEAVQARP